MANPSPEFMLLAACCAWPAGERRDAAIRQAAARVGDWDRVVRLVQRHRVAALVDHGLTSAGVDAPPPARAAIQERANRASIRSLQLAGESIRVNEVLQGAGVRCAFLKGATLGELAYGQVAIKASWDVDVLVSRASFAQADAALEAAGYRRHEPSRDFDARQVCVWLDLMKEALYARQDSGAVIELHWKLVDHQQLLPGLTVEAPLRDVRVGGHVLPTFGDEDLLAYICVHGAHHGWARLKWLADVAAFLSSRDGARIEALYAACETRRAGRCAGQALLLCERLFGLEIPERLGEVLRRDPAMRLLERMALDIMLEEAEIHTRPAVVRRMRASHFLLGRGLPHLLAELKVRLTSRRDRLELHLPRRLDWLYPLISPPLWLWRRLWRPTRT